MKINRQFRHRGFTLVELMGSVVISSLIFLLLFKVLDKVQTVFVVSQNRALAMEQGRIAMDMLVKDFQALAAANLNDPNPFIGAVPNIDWGYDSWNKLTNYGVGTVGSHPRKVIATHPMGLGRQSHVLSVWSIPSGTGQNPFLTRIDGNG